MSLLYRAMWESKADDSAATIQACRNAFDRWAKETGEGKSRNYEVRDELTDLDNALEATCTDSGSDGQLWKTTGRFRVVDGTLSALVENSFEGDDVTVRISVGRPRVIADLLTATGGGRLGGSALLDEVSELDAAQVSVLVDFLKKTDRRLPAIVFTEPPPNDDSGLDWKRLAARVATRSMGTAQVFTLGNAAVTEFRRQLGDMAAWGGAIRTYVPARVVEGSHMHRFLPWKYVVARPAGATVDGLVSFVTQQSTRRRVLPALTGPEWDSASGSDLGAANAELQQQIDSYEDENLSLTEDYEQATRELSLAQAHLERLQKVLAEHGHAGLYWGAQHAESTDEAPDMVDAISEAVLAAQMYLADDLTVPESCKRDLKKLDSHMNSAAWGNTAWRGLRALAAFVRDRRDGFAGDFWAWCLEGRPGGWPASPKKLSMREGETVVNNKKFRTCRTFDIDPAVDRSGRLYMEPHLKIAEGGGNLAPRIYFYDDTAGTTGKVHIGFVGPHYLIPNTKT
ncbi:MAG: hypothetical protein ACTH9V_10015 [Propionibacterium freudenreichii]